MAIFHPRQIEIRDDNPEGPLTFAPCKLLVDEMTTCFFKPYYPGDGPIAHDEISKYEAIREAKLDQNLRISRLYGLVRDESSDLVYGLLLSYIACGNMNLACALEPNTPADLRQPWASQITHTLKCIPEADLVWGDVKLDNVLVIDFGGGRTEGWVDKQIAEIAQGDLHGLAKILEYLGVEANS